MAAPLTGRQIVRFFAPLIFMTELNMISKSVIHAFLARLAGPRVVLAAFSISFTFYYTITSPTEVSTQLSISYLRDRRTMRHLFGFFCVMLAPPMALVQLVAWTPFGRWFYGLLFGASPEVIAQAQLATFFFSLSAPILMFRALAFAQLMLHHRTIWITVSTLLRLASLGASLVAYPLVLSGAAVGAAALVTCMAVEAAFAWWAARHFFRALPEGEGELPPYRELWRFAWPLILSQSSEMGIVMLINVFLGRLANPDLALASFGVVHGLANVLLSPLRNLVHSAQTLVRGRLDLKAMARFTHWLVAGFTLLVGGVFLSPLRDWVLVTVMGLTPQLTAYSSPAVMLAFLVAGFWGYAALFRGLLAAARNTTFVAFSGAARMLIVLTAGSVTFVLPGMNGAVFGIAAWALTFAAETLILGARLHKGTRGHGAPLFPEQTGNVR